MEYSQTSQTQNAKPRKQRKKLRYPVTHLLAITAKGTSRILDINHNGLSIGCLYPNYFPDKMRIDILSADGIFIKGLKVTKCWENSHDSLHQSHTYERTVGLEIIETDNDQTFELVELIKHIEVEGMQTAVNC